MVQVRFHGRGGQGAKIASRILGRSALLSGFYAQDFALFGAERRGAPVVSFTRVSETPIDERGYIEEPDLVVVMDDSLLKEAAAQIFHGVHAGTAVFVNAVARRPTGNDDKAVSEAKFVFLDLSGIARRLLGRNFVSAPAAGAAAKCIPAISPEALTDAVKIEVAEFELPAELIGKNAAAANEAYAAAPRIPLNRRRPPSRSLETPRETPPYLQLPQFTSPTIRHRGSAALRNTGGWRMERPVIDLAQCKRCYLCYLYCPDAAIRLDSDAFPHIDYDHCKGCLICCEECPTGAVTRETEL
jgi:pyruvate ferredoxin oxidoreductase gamma subunit